MTESHQSDRCAAALQAATDAMRREAWPEAVEAWWSLRAAGGDAAVSCLGAGAALMRQRRYDEADAALEDGLHHSPHAQALQVFYAQAATQRGDWQAALPRWRKVRQTFPDLADGYLGEGIALLNAGDLATADDVLSKGYSRFPLNADIAQSWARAAQRRGNLEEAATRWSLLVHSFADHAGIHAAAGAALLSAGRTAAARPLLRESLTKFPDNPDLIVYEAYSALHEHGHADATGRWAEVSARFPDHHLVLAHRRVVGAMSPPAVGRAAAPAPEGGRDLVLRFESLGCNCEFGMVQRHYGAEPLGLLRWVAVLPATLLQLLESNFDGVGDPAHTVLVEDISTEYLVRDLRYNLDIHTFKRVGEVDPEAFQVRERRRISFLGQKMRRDLAEGEKAFVYWWPSLDEETAVSIHRAISRRGHATLLGVRLAGETAAAGSVQRLDDRLLLGQLARDGRLGERLGWNIACDSWIEICRKAVAMSQPIH